MDIQENSQQAMNDDQELAKVLAGVSQQTEEQSMPVPAASPMMPEPVLPPTPMPGSDTPFSLPAADDAFAAPITPPEPANHTPITVGDVNSALDGIKQDAINELRPLVDKLQVSAEEKFDTYLLLLRSTDDRDLVAPAHEAAKAITDETKRAQALLDIIKEIDFFANSQQA